MQMPDGRGPKNDDQIDVVAYAVLEMYDLGPVEARDPNENFSPDAESDLVDIAQDHGIRADDVHGPMPDHLARILGRDFEDEMLPLIG